MFYKYLIKPVLFGLSKKDPETMHEKTLSVLGWFSAQERILHILEKISTLRDPRLEQRIWGLSFPNPVGLAGGFDKNGAAIPAFAALGFGFIEIGTITRYSQEGNPRPRMFRLPKDKALINRMGFNNEGADRVAARLSSIKKPAIPIGISIGKSRITPLHNAIEDYLYSLEVLYPYGDYFVVNVSSPNTPGLRDLQAKSRLDALVSAVVQRASLLGASTRRKPILVKIAPELDHRALEELLEVCVNRGIDGLVAVNTTTLREGLRTTTKETGGLSGKPLFPRALEFVRFVRGQLPHMPIIGVGGIFDANDAIKMLEAGANLVQIYTGLIYRGPLIARHINQGILRKR